MSTDRLKKQISERTGVALKEIKHAGLKDRLATATQWLSWPEAKEKQPLTQLESAEILEITNHDNTLGIGHVAKNHFQLVLDFDETSEIPDLQPGWVPNFYGKQRFAKNTPDANWVFTQLTKPRRDRMLISTIQSWFFNQVLFQRLSSPIAAEPEDLWTASNGKRWFCDPEDTSISERFEKGEIAPTGPIYGYKVAITKKEEQWLAELNITQESFRPWGKIARGGRRPLFIWPQNFNSKQEGDHWRLSFSLPSGAYATVCLLWWLAPDCFKEQPESWPSFENKFDF